VPQTHRDFSSNSFTKNRIVVRPYSHKYREKNSPTWAIVTQTQECGLVIQYTYYIIHISSSNPIYYRRQHIQLHYYYTFLLIFSTLNITTIHYYYNPSPRYPHRKFSLDIEPWFVHRFSFYIYTYYHKYNVENRPNIPPGRVWLESEPVRFSLQSATDILGFLKQQFLNHMECTRL
jgi:hypothetical protein